MDDPRSSLHVIFGNRDVVTVVVGDVLAVDVIVVVAEDVAVVVAVVFSQF